MSVHQNSFGQESSKGAQAFYHGSSVEGKALAETIQEQIKQSIGDGNTRLAKSNESYYMLKNTECPLVIVECGFLSNNGEAALLSDQAYQEKMADAIRLGVAQYLRQKAVAPSTEPQASGAADVIQPIGNAGQYRRGAVRLRG